MPPFQFDESLHHGLSPGKAATPLHGDAPGPGYGAGAPVAAGTSLSDAGAAGGHLTPSVFAALRQSDELLAYLAQSGLRVTPLQSPGDAVSRCAEMKGHVLLLDWDYPGFDPFQVCRALGLDRRPFPVVALSEQNDVFDEVLAFELGVSDFIVKPVQPRILLARIKSVMKSLMGRARTETRNNPLVFGRLTIDLTSRVVLWEQTVVELSSAEFDLLAYLAARAGCVVRRDEIQRALCKDSTRRQTRSIDSRMYRLRKRFAPYCDAQARIKSIRPQGYLFCDEGW
jgi:two-component system OmpR family response regulator